MASKGTTFANDILLLFLNGTPIANLADNAASSPLTNVYVSLHSSEPPDGGNQTSNEVAYTSYARAAVARDGTGWTVSGSATVANTALIQFPTCTGSSVTATHFAIGTASSGTGKVMYKGALSSSLNIATGIQPQYEAGELAGAET